MVQAAVLDRQFFDPFSPFDDGGVAAEVGVGGRNVAEALVVAVVVVANISQVILTIDTII